MADQEDKVIRQFDYRRLTRQCRFPLIVVYCKPTDYPEQYVARVWDLNQPTRLVAIAETLDTIREAIPDGMTRIPHTPGDDPCIEEVWI